MHLGDLDAIDGVHFITPSDQVVCTIVHKREVEEEVEEGEEEILEEGVAEEEETEKAEE